MEVCFRHQSNWVPSWSQDNSLIDGKARITKVWPFSNWEMRSLIAERNLRFTRFLSTAEPTVFDTTKPNFGALGFESFLRYVTMLSETVLRPVLMVDRKSSAVLSRFSRASKRIYADSSVRPLRRRAARMARPARVFMRRRKPWVLARRRLFGWKVRLLIRCYSKTFWWVHVEVKLIWYSANPMPSNLLNLRQQRPTGQVIFEVFLGRSLLPGQRKMSVFHNILENSPKNGFFDLQFQSLRQLNT